ncbi:hypothetical protein [Paenibacillus physcomitrellae]|uniref:Protein kinase domain-containing protein n=1 Tax=Paenibacillus physcomitrellae TaxID=1619311 RepID=A0ABQ1G8G0_9BACL|nr:hypothetical protein [Paenibacillus physcomitrellae]GGA38783.1 hypothetical protein GCM10010917_25020 [Paenibacillus physcomitrellae]
MAFNPNPGDQIQIGGTNYIIGTHPAAPGMAYAQAGRQGVVYQLIPENGEASLTMALKIFLPKFRIPSRVHLSQTMEEFSRLQGLKVCQREVLTPEINGKLIAEYPDLLYAVLMPWVHGWTWMDVLGGGDAMSPAESLEAARLLSSVGSAMEQRGIAHCDLSAPNVMFTEDSSSRLGIELVDVEQMFSPRLDPPDLLLGGSPGYASSRTSAGHPSAVWNAYADRFSGAVLIAEMLGWCEPEVRELAWGESYFDPEEMQRPCERYYLLNRTLEQRWGKETAELFARAWGSGDSRFCPTFGEWVIALTKASGRLNVADPGKADIPHDQAGGLAAGDLSIPEKRLPVILGTDEADHPDEDLKIIPASRFGSEREAAVLVGQARKLERDGQLSEAQTLYLQAQRAASEGSPLYVEITSVIQELKQGMEQDQDPAPRKIALAGTEAALNPAVGAANIGGDRMKIAGAPQTAGRSKPVVRTSRRLWWGSGITGALLLLLVGVLLIDRASSDHKQSLTHSSASSSLPADYTFNPVGGGKVPSASNAPAKGDSGQAVREEEAAKAEQEKQAAVKAALQKKYAQQVSYNKYLEWKKNKELLQARAKAEAEEEARKAAEKRAAEEAELRAQKAEQAKQAARLKAVRDQKTVKMIAYYNSAYNAQTGGHRDMAERYCRDFLEIYNTDAQYFVKTGAIGKRVGHIYKYLQSSAYVLPDV